MEIELGKEIERRLRAEAALRSIMNLTRLSPFDSMRQRVLDIAAAGLGLK